MHVEPARLVELKVHRLGTSARVDKEDVAQEFLVWGQI